MAPPSNRDNASQQGNDEPRHIAAASVLLFRGDAVLLVERSGGTMSGRWSAPGGHVDAGESTLAAATRELLEETGITATSLMPLTTHLVPIAATSGSPARVYEIAVFTGIAEPDATPQAAGDAANARFIVRKELAALPTTPGLEELIEAASLLLANPD